MKLLLLVTLLTAGATAHSISRRAVQKFGNVFECYSENRPLISYSQPLMEYKMLGCFCSHFSFRSYAHYINRCCNIRDSCYDEAENMESCEFPQNNPYDSPYLYSCSGSELICSEKNNACEAYICNCDRQAASCFSEALYNKQYEDYSHLTFC